MKKVLILDLDGTLYYQIGVQLTMGCYLALYYLLHFWRIKELLIIKDYRKIREKDIKGIVKKQYSIISKKYRIDETKVKKIIQEWMFDRPLKILPIFKDKQLQNIINKFRENNGKIIVFSDYPTEEKLKVLNIKYDKTYDSTHPEIGTLKPNPKGLNYIIKINKLKKEEVYYIGDRDSKDGQCARNCDIEYLILPKFSRRKKILEIKRKIGVE